MEKIKKFTKGILFSIGLFLLCLIICPNLFAIIFRNALLSENTIIKSSALLGIYVLTFIIVLLILHKDIIKNFKELIHEPKKYIKKGLSCWGYGFLIMLLSNLIITSIVGSIPVNEQSVRGTLLEFPLYSIPSIVFFGPFFEELIFRYGIKKAFNKELIYALTSAIAFGLLHVVTAFDEFTIANIMAHSKEFLFIIPYGALGFFFAKAYYETDNIFASIIPHMFHNSLSVLLILLTNML